MYPLVDIHACCEVARPTPATDKDRDLRKGDFCEFCVCLSRAYLGRMIIFAIKRGRKRPFSYLVAQRKLETEPLPM
eukprot:COSAG06_NODE_31034_length_528_cov_0.550117_1_plen_75_part_10